MTTVAKWAGLGYEQVPGLANRLISRYLRSQRKIMLRFFAERGLPDLAERLRQIRVSRQGMLAKNRMFQEVLNQYAERATPKAAPEAAPDVDRRNSPDVVLQHPEPAPSGTGEDHDRSAPTLAGADVSTGIVIEE